MTGFRKATRKKAKLRMGISGAPKCGKTMTAIKVGAELARLAGTKLALIDTERESADFYADVADFDTDSSMLTFSPAEYVKRIESAAKAGYGVLIIDSLSHAWNGTGGALEMKDQAAKRGAAKNGGQENTWTAWRDVTPEHNKLIDAILQYPGHVIATVRAKVEYEQVKGANGKTQVRKVGLAPVQREGLEYEFTMLAQVNEEHDLFISGSRISAVDGKVYHCAGSDFARDIWDWLESGEEVTARPPVSSGDSSKVTPPASSTGASTTKKTETAPSMGGDDNAEELQRIDAARRGIGEQAKRLGWVTAEGKVDGETVKANVRSVCGGTMPETSIGWEDALAVIKEMDPAPKTTTPAAA